MKLSELKSDFYYFSGRLSNVSRGASGAGVGAVWIILTSKEKLSFEIPNESLLSSLYLFALAFFADMMHYAYSTTWTGFMQHLKWKSAVRQYMRPKSGDAAVLIPSLKDALRIQAEQQASDKDVPVSHSWNYASYALFALKVLFCAAGYICLASALLNR